MMIIGADLKGILSRVLSGVRVVVHALMNGIGVHCVAIDACCIIKR